MRRVPNASSRRVLSLALAALAAIAVVTSGALIWLTTALSAAASNARSAIESVHDIEQAEVALLLHERATDPLARANLRRRLEGQLDRAHLHVTSDAESDLLDRTTSAVDAYLDGAAGGSAHAYSLLDELVAVNLEQAREADVRAARANRIGDVVGLAAVAFVLAGSALLAWWLNARAFRPVIELARAMEDFTAGKHRARAPEHGAAEVALMARRFNAMADAIDAQRKAQLTFLAGVAHDLRNPLHALLMASNLVRPDQPLPPEPFVRQLFERVRRSVRKLDRMVGDLLDSARVESGQLDLKPEEVDARALAEHVVDLFGDVSRRHQVRAVAPAAAVRLWCDGGRIEQVLGNLTSNAIKYSPEGGEVTVAVDRRGDDVTFSVTDHGVGMTEAEIAGLFEPYRRSERVAADIPGVGLGLFVVKRIVEAHGGTLHVESRPGRGSTFRVVLPAGDVAPPIEPARPEEAG